MYSIPLGALELSSVQVHPLESFLSVDVIARPPSAVGSVDIYPIPLGVWDLSPVQFHSLELIITVDLSRLDFRPSDVSSNNKFRWAFWAYPPCKFLFRNHSHPLI